MSKPNFSNIVFRSPTLDDATEMKSYINTLSSEETFIRLQGRQLSLAEEKKYLEEMLEKISKQTVIIIQAWMGQELVGAADLRLRGDTESHVADFGLTVKKSYRGQGLGRELANRVISESKKINGLKMIVLSVFADNQVAINLYHSLGFKDFGKLPNGCFRKNQYVDHVYMYLEL
ncbi:MAG TPA: GNAT family N-acetyltransferase [Candidatus Woesebacteria bacterium]|nr:GNAT family N-acetyltransferase [Candidatus Woesebacteria bacterium]